MGWSSGRGALWHSSLRGSERVFTHQLCASLPSPAEWGTFPLGKFSKPSVLWGEQFILSSPSLRRIPELKRPYDGRGLFLLR